MVARWQLKWYFRDGLALLLHGLKQAEHHAWKGLIAACTGLVGLVASDSLLGFANSPYKNQVSVAVGVAVSLIAIVSRSTRWGLNFRKVVMSTIYWTFSAMALIELKIGGENQLGVFSSSGSLVYNYVTAVFLFLGILLTVPFFMAADWAKDGQDFVETQWKKKQRVPTIFNPEFIDRHLNYSNNSGRSMNFFKSPLNSPRLVPPSTDLIRSLS